MDVLYLGLLVFLYCLNLFGSWNLFIGSVVEFYKRGVSIVLCFIVFNIKIIIILLLLFIFCCFVMCYGYVM